MKLKPIQKISTTLVLASLASINIAIATPSLTLDVTVGTDSVICGASSTINVDPGTDVYFCYSIINTGDVTLKSHDISNNFYGDVLTSDLTVLAPSSNGTHMGVARTINSTTALNATWTSLSDVLPTSYEMKSSADTNGPSYDFVDVSATGTALGLSDDGEANITLPFTFKFYDNSSTAIRVANNGAMLFDATSGNVSANNTDISLQTGNNLIATFWDDIDSDTGDVYWEIQGTAPNRVAIIQWENRPHFSNVGSTTFEAKLFETSNKIEFHYKDVLFENALYDNGSSASVGIGGSANFAQFSFNQSVINDNMAISFTPDTKLYKVEDTNSSVPVPYNFQDISATGTELPLTDDGATGVTMPFVFSMGVIQSADILIGNNGAMRLGVLDGYISWDNIVLSDDTEANIIAPFWDDLSTQSGTVYYDVLGTAPNRIFVVQYEGKDHYGGTAVDVVTFQVQLFESTNVIEYHYEDATFDGPVIDYGVSATVGILGGDDAMTYSYNTASLSNLFAIRFTPNVLKTKNTGSALVVVNAPDINLPESDITVSINPDTTKTVDFDIENIGNFNLIWQIEQDFIVKNKVEYKRAENAPPIKEPNPNASMGRAPIAYTSNKTSEPSKPSEVSGVFTGGFAFSKVASPNAAMSTFDLLTPGTVTTDFTDPEYSNIFAGDFLAYDSNSFYAINDKAELLKINTSTGNFIIVNKLTTPQSEAWTGMTWDSSTGKMYAISSNPTNSTLHTIDVGAGTVNVIGSVGISSIVDIAADSNGSIYAISVSTDELIGINPATGTGTSIGPLGVDADFGQSMDFNASTGILYWASCVDGSDCGKLRTIDITTGTASLVGQIGNNIVQYAPFAVLDQFFCTGSNQSWLTMSTTNGVTAGAGTSTVTLSIDSTGMPLGPQFGNFCVNSNDPDEPVKYVKFMLDVNDIIFKNGFE